MSERAEKAAKRMRKVWRLYAENLYLMGLQDKAEEARMFAPVVDNGNQEGNTSDAVQ